MIEEKAGPEIVIVGAGFAGLVAARQLKLRGHTDFIIAERENELGGVWRDNKYPNAACDIPVPLYSLSFRPGRDWTCNYASSAEIAQYARDVWDEQELVPYVRFGMWIKTAEWSEDTKCRRVETAAGEVLTPRYIIWAGGRLSRPLIPEIPGMDRFKGPIFHTARWRDDVDFKGKRIALVGGGASSLQVLPYLVQNASHLTAFIRTPSHVSARPEEYYDDAVRSRMREDPTTLEVDRKKWFNIMCEVSRQRFPMDVDSIGKAEAAWQDFMESQVADPELRRKLTPNYRFGFRRPGFSNIYYSSLSQSNVTVVRSGLVKMTEAGGYSDDGTFHEFEIAVMATGFKVKAADGYLALTGRSGIKLLDQWDAGEEGYLGVFIKNFPNLFTIDGPNTSVGSILDIFENQAHLVGEALDLLRSNNLETIEVRADVQDKFNAELDRRAEESTMIKGGEQSWMRANGSGRMFTHWPGSPAELIELLQRVNEEDFVFGVADTPALTKARNG